MAYDYIGLVNDVNRRLNEVELTSTNFATATGEYSMIKDAVNAYRDWLNVIDPNKKIKIKQPEMSPSIPSMKLTKFIIAVPKNNKKIKRI